MWLVYFKRKPKKYRLDLKITPIGNRCIPRLTTFTEEWVEKNNSNPTHRHSYTIWSIVRKIKRKARGVYGGRGVRRSGSISADREASYRWKLANLRDFCFFIMPCQILEGSERRTKSFFAPYGPETSRTDRKIALETSISLNYGVTVSYEPTTQAYFMISKRRRSKIFGSISSDECLFGEVSSTWLSARPSSRAELRRAAVRGVSYRSDACHSGLLARGISSGSSSSSLIVAGVFRRQ